MKMKKNNILILIVLFLVPGCNDDFLEKTPIETQTEVTLFKNYDNFQTYCWGLYAQFEHGNHIQSVNDRAVRFNGEGDVMANWLTSAINNDIDNDRRDRTITVPASGGGWNYSYIRDINIMLRNIESSEMTESDKAHWRSVGYFFFSYRYAELISRFGDVCWVDRVLKDDGSDDDIIYGPRTPRKEVADSVLARLQYAEKNIKVDGEGVGTNTINKATVQALLSRFCLFEGTWRRYHGLGDEIKYLEESLRTSEELMKTFPVLDDNFDELLTSSNLGNRPGIILYKDFSTELEIGSVSQRFERSTSTFFAMHRATADLYLVKSNGLPVNNPANESRPDIDMYDEFRDRDPRLLMTVAPPYSQKYSLRHNNPGIPEYPFPPLLNQSGGYQFNTAANYERPGQDPLEYVKLLEEILPNNLSKRLPAFQFQGVAMIWSIPNFPSSPTAQFRSKTGYIVWKNYALWDVVTSVQGDLQANSDKPILFMEEILLNAAEASFELGRFTQDVANRTINKLRRRTTVNMPDMIIATIDSSTDPYNPNDKVTPGRDPDVHPVLWEIRRERMVELMGLGYGFADIRRWKKGAWYLNKPIIGVKIDKQYYRNLSSTGELTSNRPAWVNNLPLVNKDFTPVTGTQGYIRRFDDPSKDGKGWDDAFYLFPIPKNDLSLNPNLKQNPGWEKY